MYPALSDIVQFDVIIFKSQHRRSKTKGSEGSVYYIIYGKVVRDLYTILSMDESDFVKKNLLLIVVLE